jgi:hypothetical protein
MKCGLAVLLILVLATQSARAADGGFEPPLSVQKRVVPAAGTTPKATVTCRSFARFMVKQIDEGEVGAAQLSVLPSDPAGPKPVCRRENAPGETVFNPADWSGYFKGVKGDYVLLDGSDGVNGALPFAVFTASGKKLFEDSAQGALHGVALDGATLTLRYARSLEGACSVVHDGAGCWSKIAAAASLDPAALPDCAAGYRAAKQEMAKGRCEAQGKAGPDCLKTELKAYDAQHWDVAPSVVIYEAETVIAPGQAASTKPLGKVRLCHPSD